MHRLCAWLLVGACTYDRDAWRDDRDEAVCEVRVACFGDADVDACVTGLQDAEQPPCPDPAAATARACLRQLLAQADACPASLEDWRIPAVCADVCPADDGS